MSNAILVQRAAVETIIEETEAISIGIGSFTSGDQFVENCRCVVVKPGDLKKIGLAFNRLLKLTRAIAKDLEAIDAEPAEPTAPTVEKAPEGAQAPDNMQTIQNQPPTV